eukprot:1158819-Pelagomonas_calceolata.AAC.7
MDHNVPKGIARQRFLVYACHQTVVFEAGGAAHMHTRTHARVACTHSMQHEPSASNHSHHYTNANECFLLCSPIPSSKPPSRRGAKACPPWELRQLRQMPPLPRASWSPTIPPGREQKAGKPTAGWAFEDAGLKTNMPQGVYAKVPR